MGAEEQEGVGGVESREASPAPRRLTKAEYKKRWRRNHRDRYDEAKKRYYGRFQEGAWNTWGRWTAGECERVLAHDRPDRELAKELGRTVQAIQVCRAKLRKGKEEANGTGVGDGLSGESDGGGCVGG